MILMPFGKYKGKPLEWIYFNDKSYFEWLENIPKDYIQEAIAEFRLCLKDIVKAKQEEGIKEAKAIIDSYITKGKNVRAVNVHSVGFEFRLGDLSLEDILNRDFTLRYYRNGKLQSIDLTKEQYQELYYILDKEWKKHNEIWEERGLY